MQYKIMAGNFEQNRIKFVLLNNLKQIINIFYKILKCSFKYKYIVKLNNATYYVSFFYQVDFKKVKITCSYHIVLLNYLINKCILLKNILFFFR